MLSAAALVLAAYAIFWLRENLQLEVAARTALEKHDKALGISDYNQCVGGVLPRPDQNVSVGYGLTVALLAAAAVVACFVTIP